MVDKPPGPKPLKKCAYCCAPDKRDALWTVTYVRELALVDHALDVRDLTCDAHLATACARASTRLRVRPRFAHGPGGTRIMPSGMVPAA